MVEVNPPGPVDPIEEELQAILAGTPWPPHTSNDQLVLPPARVSRPIRPTIHSIVTARHGDTIQKLIYYPQINQMTAILHGGKSIRYNSAGNVLRISYPGLRGILYDILDVATRWLPDRAAPWRNP
jgi:hypothetical protein